jgi:hypothetical protein
LAVVAVAIAGVGVSSAAAQQSRPEAQQRELGPEERRELDRALRRGESVKRARRERLARPEERAERERSRSAFSDLGAGEAQRVARERLGRASGAGSALREWSIVWTTGRPWSSALTANGRSR